MRHVHPEMPNILSLTWAPSSGMLAAITERRVHLLTTDQKFKQGREITDVLPANLSVGCWHPNGTSLAVGTFDSIISVFNPDRPSIQNRLQLDVPGSVTCIAFSYDGLFIVAGTANGWIVIIKADRLEPVRKIQRGKAITGIQWTDTSNFVASSIGEDLALISARDGLLIRAFPPRNAYNIGRVGIDGSIFASNGRVVFLTNPAKGESPNTLQQNQL